MKAADLLTLPADVLIRPADTIDPTIADRLGHHSGDYVVTRPGARGRSLLVDAAAAGLLARFRLPMTLVDAIIAVSRSTGADARELLDEALPLVAQLRRQRLLVVAGSRESHPIEPTLAPGTTFGDLRIADCVHLFDDAEVYRATGRSGEDRALKILRPEAGAPATRALEHELAVLERLDGMRVPRVLDSGEAEGRPYVTMSWCAGLDVRTVGQALRGAARSQRPLEVARLCGRVLEAYASLHAAGVLHGDIHPGNIRIAPDGAVSILDFGLSSCAAGTPPLPALGRGGIPEYMEPEYCRALRLGSPPPPATERSEQYALAVLCFLLLTGACYLRFDFRLDGWMEQVVDGRPRSFIGCAAVSWAAVEEVLAIALRKEPASRFAGVAAFAEALGRASRARGTRAPSSTRRDAFLERIVTRYGATRRGIPTHLLRAPTCTVDDGAAGIAYFYYRLAVLRDDAGSLATADLWSSWARQRAGDPGSLQRDARPSAVPGTAASPLLHGHAGIECVDALVRQAAGDVGAAVAAVGRFLAACEDVILERRVMLAHVGLLLGCASLIEALPPDDSGERVRRARADLVALGDQLAQGLGVRGEAPSALTVPDVMHGRSGAAFAALRWYAATGRMQPWVGAELDALSAAARVRPATVAGVLLWSLAEQCSLDRGPGTLADLAAAGLREAGDDGPLVGSPTRRYSGHGYALLARFRETEDPRWLARAQERCERAVAASDRARGGLFEGDVAIALLAEDLRRPGESCMPLLEAESRRSA